jgi:hypothetical protein
VFIGGWHRSNVRASFEHQPTVFLPKRHANIVYGIESGLKAPKLESRQIPRKPPWLLAN